ncbi:MAG: sulfite exporter TauE/SafE family protein [Actinomycetota bacterium]|nr:sulfite exporter TauE/SafE family protein [Actinomycetota bacterium]
MGIGSQIPLLDVPILLLAGFGAGVVGSAAGLASLISYPVLLAIGLPPVTANVTNTVALIGSSIGSVSGSRLELRGQDDLRRHLPVAMLGGAAGAALLLLGPPGTFQRLVPYLVAGASLLLLTGPRLRKLRGRRTADTRSDDTRSDDTRTVDLRSADVRSVDLRSAGQEFGPTANPVRRPQSIGVRVGLFLTCLYGGYFGAAAGVMILALLLTATGKSLPRANAAKNLLLGVANATAAVGFGVFADVRWAAVIPLGLGCVAGGVVGPAIVRRLPPDLVRIAIGIAGLALAVDLAVT